MSYFVKIEQLQETNQINHILDVIHSRKPSAMSNLSGGRPNKYHVGGGDNNGHSGDNSGDGCCDIN